MLIYGQDKPIATWICHQLKLNPFPENMYRAIGIAIGTKLIGGVIWHGYCQDIYGKPLLIECTIYTVDKRWATRHTLRELFQYPYRQLRVKRVQATCAKKAKRVRSTLSRLGFKFEGICREAHPHGGDAAHYSILEHECKWLKGKQSESKMSPAFTGTHTINS